MEIDRRKISEIISEMLDNPGENGLYPTGNAYDRLEAYIEQVRILALGWMHADCCSLLDHDLDPRDMIVPSTLQRALKNLDVGHADAIVNIMQSD